MTITWVMGVLVVWLLLILPLAAETGAATHKLTGQ